MGNHMGLPMGNHMGLPMSNHMGLPSTRPPNGQNSNTGYSRHFHAAHAADMSVLQAWAVHISMLHMGEARQILCGFHESFLALQRGL